jgi:hypothetical protein
MESEHICNRISFKNLKFIHIILSKLQNQSTFEFFVYKRGKLFYQHVAKGENLTNFGRGILSNFDSKLDLEKSLESLPATDDICQIWLKLVLEKKSKM